MKQNLCHKYDASVVPAQRSTARNKARDLRLGVPRGLVQDGLESQRRER